ncbi:MAG: TIGR03960 family B12-binding radical SAM protein [Eubacteriaceae bacterium]|nr:TIGR03960 family B12-binding radical SAM protein [Eubacteriaceae bacterium]
MRDTISEETISELLSQVNKPARYCGGELNSAVMKGASVRYLMAFPDVYEVGMSHLGMKILYSLLNSLGDVDCERTFAPMDDMAALMRERDIPLFSLETRSPAASFDFIGFSLQYEMCMTTVLYMLDLSGIPLRSSERTAADPIIMAGGSVTLNPEPFCDFFDMMIFGEAEEVLPSLMELYRSHRDREEFLAAASRVEGVYVPKYYEVTYDEGKISRKSLNGAPERIKRLLVRDMDGSFYPDSFIVPFMEIVHDRAAVEVMRGCPRGCRFCQAGMIYRPVRQKRLDTLRRQADSLLSSTGYEQIALSSLSSTDYTHCRELIDCIYRDHSDEKVTVSLPSLRIDHFSLELARGMQSTRTIPLTFAPEAGSQRMRDIINKNITEEDIFDTLKSAFLSGYHKIKLYFMIGLPHETDEDIRAIGEMVTRIDEMYTSLDLTPRHAVLSASVSCFVPKPHTPFEFTGQDSREEFKRKQTEVLRPSFGKHVKLSYHEADLSVLEGAFARGDRRLNDVILSAYRKGCIFDSWADHYRPWLWEEAFRENGLSMEQFSMRTFGYDEDLPWDFIDLGVDREFLVREAKKAEAALTTPNCYEKCSNCGIAARYGRCDFEI